MRFELKSTLVLLILISATISVFQNCGPASGFRSMGGSGEPYEGARLPDDSSGPNIPPANTGIDAPVPRNQCVNAANSGGIIQIVFGATNGQRHATVQFMDGGNLSSVTVALTQDGKLESAPVTLGSLGQLLSLTKVDDLSDAKVSLQLTDGTVVDSVLPCQ
ncbi:MAG: hypothetical protein AB7F86_11645 [Bdellovibrionales bacterium]